MPFPRIHLSLFRTLPYLSLLFGSVGLCGFGLPVAGFLEVLSGASSESLSYLLPTLRYYFIQDIPSDPKIELIPVSLVIWM